MRSLAASVLCLSILSGSAAADVEAIRTYDPRPFGYFAGDTIERSFEIVTNASDTLEAASLPRPGALNYWLEIRSVSHKTAHRSGRTTHTISLVYQTFYAPIDPRKIAIPELRISFATEKGPQQVTLPGLAVLASPLREIFPEKSGETTDTFLRPDPKPVPLSTRTSMNSLIMSTSVALLALALLARHLAWWPFDTRRSRPFARAARDIDHVLSGRTAGTAAHREAALILHRAFDESGGERVFASDIAHFLEQRPEHQESALAIARFFEASRAVFFGSSKSEPELSATQLINLAARLRSEERSAR